MRIGSGADFVKILSARLGENNGIRFPDTFQIICIKAFVSEDNLNVGIKAWMEGKDHSLTLLCSVTIIQQLIVKEQDNAHL